MGVSPFGADQELLERLEGFRLAEWPPPPRYESMPSGDLDAATFFITGRRILVPCGR
jgi:hypothetical protein